MKEEAEQDKIPSGERNITLTSLAGSMRTKSLLDEGAIAAALLYVNQARCEPPLPDEEVRRIARSVMAYKPSRESDGGAELDQPPATLPDTLTINGEVYVRAGVSIAAECVREECTYFSHYLVYYDPNNPKHGARLDHKAYHFAEKRCEAAQNRVTEWLERNRDSQRQMPEGLERQAAYWEGRVCA